jgi:hypothetical protein
MITFDNVYSYLEEKKKELNFIERTDVDMPEFGKCPFSTLFYHNPRTSGPDARRDIPEELKDFLIEAFKISDREYDFLQVQKYEIGEYILPHKDTYPCFGLVMLSTSDLDGLVVQQKDGTYKFHPDKAGTFVNVPKYSWHWVNPVREKTRYTAVYGLHPLNDHDSILDI